MNKEKYLELRNGLYNEAEKLINEGKIEEGQAKMAEIEKLDNDFENAAQVMANLNALKDNNKISNIAPINEGEKLGEVAAGEEITNSLEYRKAFMNYVTKGESIPGQFKNAVATTTDLKTGELIPDTLIQRIIEKIESTGMILPLVTRTSYKGGVTIPTSNVKPTATWVNEGQGSTPHNKTFATITFAYHKLRCAISHTLEVETMALPVFETVFINNVVEAMTKELEKSIITGAGANQPEGILIEANLEKVKTANQNVALAAGKEISYKDLIAAEAALPLAYESGAVWFTDKKTFMECAGMVDSSGQPIARTNYGIGGRPERILLGRTVILNDYMPTATSAALGGTVKMFLFNPKDYILNTNLNMTLKKYENNDTDDFITKAIMLVDGKAIDLNSLVTITKA